MATPTKIKKTSATRPAHWLDGSQIDTWHPSAPADVVEAYTTADGQEGWEAWTDYLESRRSRPTLDKLVSDGEHALLWGMPGAVRDSETYGLVARLGQTRSFVKRDKRRRWADVAADWLDAASIASASTAHAYECLAWCYALPRLPNCIGENLWWKLVNHLVSVAREARQWLNDRDPLTHQLLAGELALSLAYTLPEIRLCHDQALAAWTTIAEGLNDCVDLDGVPSQKIVTSFPALVASWTRARLVANRLGEDVWQDPASRRHELALVSLARLTTVDPELWQACLLFELEKPTRKLLRALASQDADLATVAARQLPSPSMHSEETRFSLLCPTWALKSPRLTVNYSEPVPLLELSAQGEQICSGPWGLTVQYNGEAREVSGPWENVCWYSDEDVDFLEIEAPLGHGLQAQRQVLLAREDGVLLLADAILAQEPGRIEYRGTLPVCTPVGFHGAEETREGHLAGDRARLLVLPLALPEWRCDGRSGTLEMAGGNMVLRQVHAARAAYAPLLIDLDSRRSNKECTWRQLTVAEARNPQAPDVAIGYRAQIGKSNWLVYRSLAPAGIRSLLGQQVKAEFLFGRIKPNGACKRLLEIESMDAS